VSAEKLGTTAAALSRHPLPEIDRFLRAVTGSRHEDRSHLIRFQFLSAGKGEAEGDIPDLWSDLAEAALVPQHGSQDRASGRDRLVILDPSLRVIRGDMRHLVSENGGELTISHRDFKKASIHAYFPSGNGKGIGAGIIKNLELPIRSGKIDDRLQAIRDPVHASAGVGIS